MKHLTEVSETSSRVGAIMPESSSAPTGTTSEARIAKALAHPLRARILERLGERVATPAELATELEAPLGVVSYHVRMLRNYDCIELVRTEPVRGALQHYYRATTRVPAAEQGWQAPEMDDEGMRALFGALSGAELDDPEIVLSRSPLELDERALGKLNRLLERTREQALAIAAESAERGGGEIATELGLLHFRRAGAAQG
jgi:DNA-binding transcriptional ArsR family regulator